MKRAAIAIQNCVGVTSTVAFILGCQRVPLPGARGQCGQITDLVEPVARAKHRMGDGTGFADFGLQAAILQPLPFQPSCLACRFDIGLVFGEKSFLPGAVYVEQLTTPAFRRYTSVAEIA